MNRRFRAQQRAEGVQGRAAQPWSRLPMAVLIAASVLTVIVASSILSRSPSAGASGPSAGQLYTSAVLAQDPYSLYDLQQTSGSTVYDASPNGDNASVSGDGSEEGQTPGPFSGSSFFNFGGQELSPNMPFSADSMTLSAWVNLNSDDGGNNLEIPLGRLRRRFGVR